MAFQTSHSCAEKWARQARLKREDEEIMLGNIFELSYIWANEYSAGNYNKITESLLSRRKASAYRQVWLVTRASRQNETTASEARETDIEANFSKPFFIMKIVPFESWMDTIRANHYNGAQKARNLRI